VVYLNGTEVVRSNMPTGTVTSTTLAASSVDGAGETGFYATSVNPGLLVAGTNVLAVEIHQRTANSSDLSFDLELVASVSSLPVVSITATDATAAEPGTDPATFTVSRTGDTSLALTVSYTVAGTATPGSDYTALAGSVTIPIGAASATIQVSPLDDALAESGETVAVTLASSAAYTRGTLSTATVTIADNEAVATVTLVAAGSTWKYLDNGSNQGTAWRASGFDDTSWSAGPAQLGYGDGDEATVVSYGPDAANRFVTTYFRRAFTVTNPAQYSALTLRLLRDDGGVVYLNGTEVFRSNMPTGSITSTTKAASNVGDAEEKTFYATSVNPSLLVTGTNVLAVEIHQRNADSSDLSFDLQLVGSASGSALAAATSAVRPTARLTAAHLQPVLAAAIDRWAAAGLDAAALAKLHSATVVISALGGSTLGLADAAANLIRIDDDAAGHGWFVDPTPWDDAEFATTGNQGEQHRMDLLTVLTHELGHLLGYDHAEDGVMQESLLAGTREMPAAGGSLDAVKVDQLFAAKPAPAELECWYRRARS
jgi:hypothetical protein